MSIQTGFVQYIETKIGTKVLDKARTLDSEQYSLQSSVIMISINFLWSEILTRAFVHDSTSTSVKLFTADC